MTDKITQRENTNRKKQAVWNRSWADWGRRETWSCERSLFASCCIQENTTLPVYCDQNQIQAVSEKLFSALCHLLNLDLKYLASWNPFEPFLVPVSPASVSEWRPGCLTPTRPWCCQQWRSWWSSWSSFPRTLTITTCCWRNLPLLWWPCCLESLKFSMLPWGTSTWLCRRGKGSGVLFLYCQRPSGYLRLPDIAHAQKFF